MANPLLSPGVQVLEFDDTVQIPAVSATAAASAGAYVWGPVNQPVIVPSKAEYVRLFGEPNDANYTSWFAAANFYDYGNNVLITRAAHIAANTGSLVSNESLALNAAAAAPYLIMNSTDYHTKDQAGFNSGAPGTWAAKYPGALGNSISVFMTDENEIQITVTFVTSDTFHVGDTIGQYVAATGGAIPTSTSTVMATGIITSVVGSTNGSPCVIKIRNTTGTFNASVTGATADTKYRIAIHKAVSGSLDVIDNAAAFVYLLPSTTGTVVDLFKNWAYANLFTAKPGTSKYAASLNATNDQLHVVVVDTLGLWSGTAGTVLEKYAFLSKSPNAIADNGGGAYYKDVINAASPYIWWTGFPTTALSISGFSDWGTAAGTVGLQVVPANSYAITGGLSWVLAGGADGQSVTNSVIDGPVSDGDLINAFALYAAKELYEVSLLIAGDVDEIVQASVINLAATRMDCVAFVSPRYFDVIGVVDDITRTANVLDWRQNRLNLNSSYAVADSGWKFMYDKYNDKNRWVPLNGDIAGLCAYTDDVAQTWYSPMGYNRGILRNVIKLAWNPIQAYRDQLYVGGINPVITEPGAGTILLGDKTLLSTPSAFDRINVRRLFIIIEKAVSISAKYALGELNDNFSQAGFRSQIDSYLRGIEAGRGIYDYQIVCDSTNNTPTVVDANQFIASIYVKPARSINFITLNFTAVPTGVSFEEIGA